MNKIQDSTNVQLPLVIQFELEKLRQLMTQLDETPVLANDYCFQDIVKLLLLFTQVTLQLWMWIKKLPL